MTEFEKKLLADLEAGHDVNDILDEFKNRLNVAVEEYEAKKEAEARAKAEAEKTLEETGCAIAELANRMLLHELTADDVAWVLQVYFSQIAEDVKVEFSAMDIEDLRAHATNMLDSFTGFWGQVFQPKSKAKACNCESDEDVIRNFVQKIL